MNRLTAAIGVILAAAAVAAGAVLVIPASSSPVCPAITGAPHADSGPLTITASGTYNGDGQAIVGGENSITVQASGVTICNYHLKNPRGSGVYVNGPHRNIVIDSVVIDGYNAANVSGEQYAAGVACWNCERLTVSNSVICNGSWSNDGSCTSNGRSWGNGIWLKRTTAATAGADTFRGNVIYGGYDDIGSEPEDDPNGGFGSGTVIEGNLISGCHDDGIQVEGRVQNVTVRGNEVKGCGTGVALAPVLVGPLTIESNYIHDLVPGLSTAFFCYKLGDHSGGSTASVTFTNNNCITGNGKDSGGEGAGGFAQTNSGLNYKITASGNCTQTGRYVIEFGDTPAAGTSFHDNKLITSDTSRFAKWGGNRYSLAGLQSFGQELGSVTSSCSPGPTVRPTLPPTPPPTPATPTRTAIPTPTASATATTVPPVTQTPVATVAPTATKAPTPTPRCEVRVRLNGVQQWVACPPGWLS